MKFQESVFKNYLEQLIRTDSVSGFQNICKMDLQGSVRKVSHISKIEVALEIGWNFVATRNLIDLKQLLSLKTIKHFKKETRVICFTRGESEEETLNGLLVQRSSIHLENVH